MELTGRYVQSSGTVFNVFFSYKAHAHWWNIAKKWNNLENTLTFDHNLKEPILYPIILTVSLLWILFDQLLTIVEFPVKNGEMGRFGKAHFYVIPRNHFEPYQ